MGEIRLVIRHVKPPKKNGQWITCEECGEKQFRVAAITKINGLIWRCRNPKCEHLMVINVR